MNPTPKPMVSVATLRKAIDVHQTFHVGGARCISIIELEKLCCQAEQGDLWEKLANLPVGVVFRGNADRLCPESLADIIRLFQAEGWRKA